MKKMSLAVLLLLLLQWDLAAQSEKYTRDVTKITILEPGISHEFALGKSTTFFLRGGLTITTALDYNDELVVQPRAFGSASFRKYYNFKKREYMERNIDRNSANYVALLFLGASSPFKKRMDYEPYLNEPGINAGIVWGLQRNYPSSRFSLDLNIGVGYNKMGYESGVTIISEFNIGFWLGKK